MIFFFDLSLFLSTLSLRRATSSVNTADQEARISIHALLAESDGRGANRVTRHWYISIHALLAESDVSLMLYDTSSLIFLSTLSLRRATLQHNANYNYRSISIHALLAESDYLTFFHRTVNIHFYPRSPCGERRLPEHSWWLRCWISIHALLAESDAQSSSYNAYMEEFLSTLSLRRATRSIRKSTTGRIFLSTLSLRRATDKRCKSSNDSRISIHALLAESDRNY